LNIESEIKQTNFGSEGHKAAINILFTGNWLYAHMAKILKPHKISPEQYNVMRILRGQHPKPATVGLLTARMLNKMSNASRLVEKLRQKGLCDRKLNDTDRRACDVSLTSKGLDLLNKLDQEMELSQQLFEHMDKKEMQMLNSLLDKVRN
jgi:DNA-binding MarR family transcriptional regulator